MKERSKDRKKERKEGRKKGRKKEIINKERTNEKNSKIMKLIIHAKTKIKKQKINIIKKLYRCKKVHKQQLISVGNDFLIKLIRTQRLDIGESTISHKRCQIVGSLATCFKFMYTLK